MSEETFIMTVEKSEWDKVTEEIEQLKKERFQVMWKFKLYADYVKSRNPSLHDRISSDLGSDVEGYQTEVEQLKKDSEYKTICIRKGNDLEFELKREIGQLKRINTLLEESNDFYSDKDMYWRIPVGGGKVREPIQDGDKGEFARETAKQIAKIRSE